MLIGVDFRQDLQHSVMLTERTLPCRFDGTLMLDISSANYPSQDLVTPIPPAPECVLGPNPGHPALWSVLRTSQTGRFAGNIGQAYREQQRVTPPRSSALCIRGTRHGPPEPRDTLPHGAES